MDSYQAAYWPSCFPVLFPYGDACDGILRRTPLHDSQWVCSLLERVDRVEHGAWRLHLDFIAVCFSTMHRRQMLRSIRARVRSGGFQKDVAKLLKTTSVNWGAVADIIGDSGGLKEALLSEKVESDVKTLLRSMQLSQMKVPCTDGYRTKMRHQMRSLQVWAGLPLIFFTLNPADVKHPFTLLYSSTASSWESMQLPPCDRKLQDLLRSVNLGKIVAKDPVAAVKAFQAHVQLFFAELLGCACSPAQLHSDGIAACTGAGGLLGDVMAAYGSVEPQMRGSLHMHMLLHILGFVTPQQLLARCPDHWDKLQHRLREWVESICFTSVEALPRYLGLSDRKSALKRLRPLPYTERQKEELGERWKDYIADVSKQWLPYESVRAEASGSVTECMQAPSDEAPAFVAWASDYTSFSAANPSESWDIKLLYDVRTSAVHCGLLHECRPATCHKGFLGKIGFCRLGFWHWWRVPGEERTWMRCHGKDIERKPRIGTMPPELDELLTERHHPYFGRVNPGVLCAVKCNHDIRTILTFPPACAQGAKTGTDAERLAARLAWQINNATHYVTDYAGKTQPHMKNLFRLLQIGQERLEQQDRERVDSERKGPRDRAWRTFVRMVMSCQKRVHKSMQEMVSYLLGVPENYCTHEFRLLYYGNMIHTAEEALPLSGAMTGTEVVPPTQDASIVPPREPALSKQQNEIDIDADKGVEEDVVFAEQCDDYKQQNEIDLGDDTGAEAKVVWATQCDDYKYRGEALKDWPLYFYVAGVSRWAQGHKLKSSHVYDFDPSHPAAHRLRQKVRTANAWCVPELAGPTVPSFEKDPEKRAMILLVLLKPWPGQVASLLDSSGASGRHTTWSAAFHEFFSALQQDKATCGHDERPQTFSPAYWAHRTVAIIQNFDNMSMSRVDVAQAGVRQNPDAAMDVSDTHDVTDYTINIDAGAGGSNGSDVDDGDGLSDLPGDADEARARILEEEGRAEPKFATHWEMLDEIVHGESELFPRLQQKDKSGERYQEDFNLRNRMYSQPSRKPSGHRMSEREPLPPAADPQNQRREKHQCDDALPT